MIQFIITIQYKSSTQFVSPKPCYPCKTIYAPTKLPMPANVQNFANNINSTVRPAPTPSSKETSILNYVRRSLITTPRAPPPHLNNPPFQPLIYIRSNIFPPPVTLQDSLRDSPALKRDSRDRSTYG